MNKNFNVKELARETENAHSARSYTSWVNVVRLLDNRGFNRWEAEVILRSKMTRWARDMWDKPTTPTASALAAFLDEYSIVPGCHQVNSMVMGTFGKEHGLELNGDGVPCRRGTMPGNPKGGSVLVPLGTPRSCDPTSELYWCM